MLLAASAESVAGSPAFVGTADESAGVVRTTVARAVPCQQLHDSPS